MSLKSIAKAAGVSISTVSLVLSGKGRISDLVRERVLQAAKDLKYKSPLYSQEGATVAILFPLDPEWRHVLEFVGVILSALEAKLSEAGYVPVLVPISFNDEAAEISRKLDALNPRAVGSVHYINEELFAALEQRGVPVVIINRSLLQDKFCTVCVDDFQGAYEAGKYLLERTGGGRVVYIGYEKSIMTNLIDDRMYGFQKALLESGCERPQQELFYVSEPLPEQLDKLLRPLFSAAPPNALYVYDDYLALFVSAALERLEVGLCGRVELLAPGDTLDYSLPCTPQFSTMSIDTRQLGELGAELLLSRLRRSGFELLVRKTRQNLVARTSKNKTI